MIEHFSEHRAGALFFSKVFMSQSFVLLKNLYVPLSEDAKKESTWQSTFSREATHCSSQLLLLCTMDESIGIVPVPTSYWVSLGHSEEYAAAMTRLKASLNRETSDLKRLNQGHWLNQTSMPPDTKTYISIGTDVEGSLLRDDSLLPLWKDFA